MKYEKATAVRVIRPYVIEVAFADGLVREIDVGSRLCGEMFEPLKDPDYFGRAAIDPVLGVVTWPNGADFSPEFLYSGGVAAAKDRTS
jgi:hypothetical protein